MPNFFLVSSQKTDQSKLIFPSFFLSSTENKKIPQSWAPLAADLSLYATKSQISPNDDFETHFPSQHTIYNTSHTHNFECVHRELLSRSETNNATTTTTTTRTQPIDNPMMDQSSEVQTTTQHSSIETTTTTKESSVSTATTTTELLSAIAVFPRYHK